MESSTSENIQMSSLSSTSNLSEVNDNTTEIYEDYYYTYDASFQISPGELVPVSVVYGATLILGIVGNSLVILSVTRYRRMKNITNIFLLSLATADLLLLLICVPVKLASFLTFTWTFGEVMCKAVYYFQNVSAICSVTTLTTMSIERYYAILHPMKAKYVCTKGRTRRAILTIWGLSFILAAPVLHVRMLREVGFYTTHYWCQQQFPTNGFHQLFEIYMALILLIVPVAVMSFAYISICKELWIVTYQRSAMRSGNVTLTPQRDKNAYRMDTYHAPTEKSPVIQAGVKRLKYSSEDDKTRKQVIKMLVSVILLFVICWAPIIVNNLLVAFGVLQELNHGYLKPMRQGFYILAYANSCVNPILYGFMSKNFRETFKHALCSCVRGRVQVRKMQFSRQSSIQTRTTCTVADNLASSRSDCDGGYDKSEFGAEQFELHINSVVNTSKLEVRDEKFYDSDEPVNDM